MADLLTNPTTALMSADALFDALVGEGRALQRLKGVLETQRQAVAENDREAIEESVNSIGRILLVLDEARRRRQMLVKHLTGQENVPLADLEEAFDDPLPDQLLTAHRAVMEAGVALRGDVAINKHIIDRTLQLGDQFLQRLFTDREPSPHYPSEPGTDHSPGAVMLDRQA